MLGKIVLTILELNWNQRGHKKTKIEHLSSNISNTRKSVSSGIQTLRSGLKKRGAAEFFLTNFEVFGYLMKHSFECLI